MKKIEDFLNDRLPHAGLLPHSLMHSVAPLVLGLFVACLVTLSCNTSDVLIESFELLLIFDLLFMILSRYSFQYVVFKVRGTPQARLLSANGDGEIRTLDPLLARQVLSQLSYTPKVIWHPPALPCRLQHSTIGRLGLNRRVRDGNGCVPQPHQHQNSSEPLSEIQQYIKPLLLHSVLVGLIQLLSQPTYNPSSLERR